MCPAPPATPTTTTSASQPLSTKSEGSASTISMDAVLQTCTPQQLAETLVASRFGGDSVKAAKFLQESLDAVHSKATNANTTINAAPSSTNTAPADLGKPLLQTPLETSLLTPRAGKVSLQLYERGLVATHLKTPSLQLILPASAVSHLLLFAKPEDY